MSEPKTVDTNEGLEESISQLLSEYSIHPQETHMDGCIYEDDDSTCDCDYKFEFKQYTGWLNEMTTFIKQYGINQRIDELKSIGKSDPLFIYEKISKQIEELKEQL